MKNKVQQIYKFVIKSKDKYDCNCFNAHLLSPYYHFVNLIINQLNKRKIEIQTELEIKPRYTDGLSIPHPLVITSLIDCVAAVQGKYSANFLRNVGIPKINK